VVLAVLLAVLAGLLAAGPERVGTTASALFQAYVDAQATMLRAAGNLTEDGRAEFAVLLDDAATPADFQQALGAIRGVAYARESAVPGWVVITTEPGDRTGLDAVLALPQSRIVVPNRGLWICH
jgi:hypothetical protein